MDLDEPDYDSEEANWPGATRTWTTAPQWAWLKQTRGPYLAAKKCGRRGIYLDSMYTDFFEEYSECRLIYGHRDKERLSPEEKEVLAEAVQKRKKQLFIWHKNRDRKHTSTRKLSSLLSAVGISKKGGRLPQPVVREKTKEMQAELGRKLDPRERLNNMKACTKEAFVACSSELKQEIKKKIAQAKEDALNRRTGRAVTPDPVNRTPEQYQNAIDLAPQLFEGVLKPYAAASGWMWSVVGAGPLLKENGKIGHMSTHFGHKEGGVSFAQAHMDFEEQCVVPMGRFAKRRAKSSSNAACRHLARHLNSQEDMRPPPGLPTQESNLVPTPDMLTNGQNSDASRGQHAGLRMGPSGDAVQPPVIPSHTSVPTELPPHVELLSTIMMIDPLTHVDKPGPLDPGYDAWLAARINSMGRASETSPVAAETDDGARKCCSPRGHATLGGTSPVAVAASATQVASSSVSSSETGGSRQLWSA
ncbi:hypothetical protein C8T65DRAFT_701762 [Cerioporus squamosus]|nr:hypothetical protein C8T65DRAFT_701762 [Cerioporus squamosus]